MRFDLAAQLTGSGFGTQFHAIPSVSSIQAGALGLMATRWEVLDLMATRWGVLGLMATRWLQKFLGLQASRLKSSRKHKLLKTKNKNHTTWKMRMTFCFLTLLRTIA